MSAARITNESPCRYGRAISVTPRSATARARSRTIRIDVHVTVERSEPEGQERRDRPFPPFLPFLPLLPMRSLIVAIDGPSGTGKGTVARAVARALGYRYVDSGAMYRAVGWKARHDAVPLDDEDAVARLAERSLIDVTSTVAIDGHDVTREI